MTARPMRYRVNPFRSAGVVAVNEAVRAERLRFHRSLPGYEPTPLVSLPGLARRLGLGAVLVKDESRRFGLNAFKALGAVWAVERLRAAGGELTTLAAATDGNHGRAVAWAARRLGLGAVIFLPAHAAQARVQAIIGEGAEVVLVPGTYDDTVVACADRSREEGWQVVADVGYEGYLEIPAWVVEGYGTLFDEIDDQVAASRLPVPDIVLVQGGVGSLAAAAVRHYRRTETGPGLAVVEPVDADPLFESASTADGTPAPSTGGQSSIMACLNCGTVSLGTWPLLRGGIDAFFTLDDAYAIRALRRFAHPERGDPRIVAGESGAAGLAGLLALFDHAPFGPVRQAIHLGAASTVLLLVTEGATDPVAWARHVGPAP